MRVLIIVLIVAVIMIVSGIIAVNRWSATEYGRLDWRAAVILKYIEVAKIQLFREGDPPDESRRISREKSRIFKSRPIDLHSVVDMEAPGPAGKIPVRVYTPGTGKSYPVVVYYHGGGWFMGGLETHDVICRKIAAKALSIVVSVDYCLAPEHPFPAAVDDAYAAAVWVSGNAKGLGGDPSRIAVAGDSAGANLAAVVSLLARDRKKPAIACQVLVYPSTDSSRLDTKSMRDFAEGYYLTRKYIEIFRKLYAPDPADWKSPLLSPLLAPTLKNLPPAVIVTAQFDPLRDEGEAYASRLKSAGVPVVLRRFDGIIHGFLPMDRLFPQADEALSLIAAELQRVYAVKGR